MIFDKQNRFSEDQAITATAASTNIVDTGTAKDVSKGAPVRIFGRVTEAFDTFTSLAVAIQTDTVENFASPTTLYTATILFADLDAIGDLVLDTLIPRGAQRFLRLYYTVAGGPPTVGKITAGIVFDSQSA